MLDDSDYLARKCVYYKGKCEVLFELEMELKSSGVEIPEKIERILNSKLVAENNRFEMYQHQYIDSIGGNEKLKV